MPSDFVVEHVPCPHPALEGVAAAENFDIVVLESAGVNARGDGGHGHRCRVRWRVRRCLLHRVVEVVKRLRELDLDVCGLVGRCSVAVKLFFAAGLEGVGLLDDLELQALDELCEVVDLCRG